MTKFHFNDQRFQWFSLLSFLEDINDEKSNFVEKNNLWAFKIAKRGMVILNARVCK